MSIIIISIGIVISVCLFILNREEKAIKAINIGNALEAPKDIPWDVEMKKEYFSVIKEKGFNTVRLPVRFSDYAKDSKDYILDEDFMQKLDTYINEALEQDLVLILDFHHFVEIMEDPQAYHECFLNIWEQVSNRYKDYPDELYFEILNEPQKNLKGGIWNLYLSEAVEVIRTTNPERKIIVGPDNFYSVDSLDHLKIPKDKNIIVSFHYYEPNNFTFQGNPYHEGYTEIKDVSWKGTQAEKEYLANRFSIAKHWGEENNVPIFLGEFGANEEAPFESRVLWTSAVREYAEKSGFGWSYWEFASSFGIYDEENKKWNELLLKALIP